MQGGIHAAEGLCAGGQLHGEAVDAYFLGLVQGLAGHAEAAREHLVAGPLGDEVGLAGQKRFVDVHPPAADDLPVDDDLVAGVQHQDVTQNELGRVDGLFLAVADHRRFGPGQQRDLVQHALGAHFLDDADERVDEDDPDRHEGVGIAAQQSQSDAEAEQDVVDEGENVLADDLEVGAAGLELNVISLAARSARQDLFLGEAPYLSGCCHRGGVAVALE